MTENIDRPKPKYNEGDTVYTPEGTAGEISTPGEWDDANEDWSYFVEWEDGKADTQTESFFKDDDVMIEGGW